MKHLLALLALIPLLLAGCAAQDSARSVLGISPTPHRAAAPGALRVPHCAELFARAMASPKAPVVGAWSCLDPTAQQGAIGVGAKPGDAGLQDFASGDPVYTSEHFVVQGGAWYYFQLENPATNDVRCMRVTMDASGQLVADWAFRSSPGACDPNPPGS